MQQRNVLFGMVTALACGLGLYAGSVCAQQQVPAHDKAIGNRAPLEQTPFVRLPLGSIHPEGWLLQQLQLQNQGLTGHAEELYDVLDGNSGWLGGSGENWERGPYYVRGLVTLAHTLDDPKLKQQAQKWVNWALESQEDNGWFGPHQNDDWWPRMVVLWYLRDYYEATGDKRIIPFFLNYFRYQVEHLPNRPLQSWGKARAGDNLDVVLWTYNQTGEAWLLELGKILHEQAYDWTRIYGQDLFQGNAVEAWMPNHIVNVSQAFKFMPVSWQLTGDASDRAAFQLGVDHLMQRFGRYDGQINGTERLTGQRAIDGVELCADVERIVSTGIAASILGDPKLGDQIEKIAYNSLPSSTTADLTGMTYYQLVNQIAATYGGHGFLDDKLNDNMPGPHSGFPCCCHNWHMGWPKLVQHMWAATVDEGLAVMVYGPSRVEATVAGNVPCTITQETEYPFRETVVLKVNPEREVTFPLALRIPEWSTQTRISVNGQALDGIKAGSYKRIARSWKSGDVVEVTFPMSVRVSRWVNNSVGVERGPLAYALRIGHDWSTYTDYKDQFDEYEIRPTSPWNYALDVDLENITHQVQIKYNDVSAIPWSRQTPPVVMTLPARRLPQWGLRAQAGSALFGLVDGGWNPRATEPVHLTAGQQYKVRVVAEGDRFRIYMDGSAEPVMDVRDASYAKGWIGFRAYEASAQFDDVKINGRNVSDFNRSASNWKTFGGKWTVRDGQYMTQPARDSKAVYQPSQEYGDFSCEFSITLDASGNAGLMFRGSDARVAMDGYRGYYLGFEAGEGTMDAAEPPVSPVVSDQPIEDIELVPFGSTSIRIGYFPLVEQP